MAGQEPRWRWVAIELGSVVEGFLDEFREMCRGSDHEEQARAALGELASALAMVQSDTPILPGMARVQSWGWRCERCEHEWVPRDTSQAPRICPKCKTPYWDRPRRVGRVTL